MSPLALADIIFMVTDTFDQFEIPYLVGGSVASILYGFVRTTVDADLVADIKEEHVNLLAHMWQDAFYVDPSSIQQAHLRRSSFNIIHWQTSFKIDIFIPKQRAFDKSQMQRRVAKIIGDDTSRQTWVATAEDTILAKLEWYRMGGEVSERQWRDVLGVIQTQAERLDKAYLRYWASELKVADLLDLALQSTGN